MSRSCSMDSHKGRCPATAKVGPVEVLGAFDLAAGLMSRHVLHAEDNPHSTLLIL